MKNITNASIVSPIHSSLVPITLSLPLPNMTQVSGFKFQVSSPLAPIFPLLAPIYALD
jgi:hypothetical protein